MTKPLVLYHTIYGSARRYAEWIAAGLGVEFQPAKNIVIPLSPAPSCAVSRLFPYLPKSGINFLKHLHCIL